MSKRDIDGDGDLDLEGDEHEGAVEPILEAVNVYCQETLALMYQPYVISYLMWWRYEIMLPVLYGIRGRT